MSFVLITHEVEDYPAWKKGFDEASALRKDAGEIAFQVLSYEGHPKVVVHFSEWQSLQAAKLFFESDEVELIREQLGVRRPNFVYLNEIEKGVL